MRLYVSMKRVLVAGATGLIGHELIILLLENKSIEEVVSLARKPLSIDHPKLIQLKVDFDSLGNFAEEIYGDAVYCCIGTTKNKTPNLKEYYKIDHDYPVNLAVIASRNEVKQFHLISALGANEKSNIFYNRLKGETEQDIKKLRFNSIHIYQPSLLTGKRQEIRPLEAAASILMKIINPLLIGNLKKYRSIRASTIAQAMINQTLKQTEGIHTYSSQEIKDLV